LWYPKSLWMMEYADLQLMVILLAIWVTIIYLSSWTKAWIHSALSTVCEVVGWPKQSSSVMLVLSLWNLSTSWYTFLCIMQFSLYCANILLWILEAFTPLWPQKSNDSMLLNNGAVWKQAIMFTLWLHEFHWTKWLPHNTPRLSSICSTCDVHKSTVCQITRSLHPFVCNSHVLTNTRTYRRNVGGGWYTWTQN